MCSECRKGGKGWEEGVWTRCGPRWIAGGGFNTSGTGNVSVLNGAGDLQGRRGQDALVSGKK